MAWSPPERGEREDCVGTGSLYKWEVEVQNVALGTCIQTTDHSRGFLQRVHQWEEILCVCGATWVWMESSDLLIIKQIPFCLVTVLGLRAPEEGPWPSSRIPGPALLAANPSSVAELCITPAETVALLVSIFMQLHWINFTDSSLPISTEMMPLQHKTTLCAKIHTGNLSQDLSLLVFKAHDSSFKCDKLYIQTYLYNYQKCAYKNCIEAKPL